MALQVICPAGCRLQVPRKCAGTMVRCPKCSEIIKIAEMSAVKDIGKGMQSLTAELATEKEIADYRQRSTEYRKRTAKSNQQNTANQQNQTEQPNKEKTSDRTSTKTRPRRDSKETNLEEAQQEKQRWRLPGEKSKFEEKETAKQKHRKHQGLEKESTSEKSPDTKKKHRKRRSASGKPLKHSSESAAGSEDQPLRPKPDLRGSEIVAATLADEQPAIGVSHDKQARSRSIFVAAALVFAGIFLILPAISPFLDYVNSEAQTPIPNWAGWLVFVGLLQFSYATYAYQLADWTTVWVVAITMLVLSVITSFLLAGLALSPPGGFVSRIFQIPISMTMKAEIWLLILLLITSLIGYLSGREAFRWKQAEDRWQEKYAASR